MALRLITNRIKIIYTAPNQEAAEVEHGVGLLEIARRGEPGIEHSEAGP